MERNSGAPTETTTTTTTSASPTSTGNGITTPTPTQPGLTDKCNKFYLVKTGEGCADIASKNGISLEDFYAWNTGVGANCETLWANTNYCVGIIGGTTTPPTTTPTTTGNGITTPTPTQPGLISSCNKFYLVKTGEGCADIASNNGISLDDFYAWNTGVGKNCETLWANTNYCVGIIGGTTTTPTKPTTTDNGIATPTPTQPGLTSNCNKFYLVKTGEGCADIASKNGISLADFYKWNTGVGSNCETLWANTNYCVGIIGGTTTTTTKTTTTKTGNGIATPTPTQPGMTPNCDKFYFVNPGDGCADIAKNNNISLDNFYRWNTGAGTDCSTMWASAYVCVHAFA